MRLWPPLEVLGTWALAIVQGHGEQVARLL